MLIPLSITYTATRTENHGVAGYLVHQYINKEEVADEFFPDDAFKALCKVLSPIQPLMI